MYIGPGISTAPLGDRDFILRGLLAAAVLQAVDTEAGAIAELGAGLSGNLFNLWIRGAPTSAQFFGCELTAGGRDAATAQAVAEPRMRFSSHAFDWDSPDYSFIPELAKHVTVFSSYSIEQIPPLRPEVFVNLLQRTQQADTVQCPHLEPLGRQYTQAGRTDESMRAGRDYALQKNYNLSARSIFEKLARDGVIRILETKVDAFGYTDKNLATIGTVRARRLLQTP